MDLRLPIAAITDEFSSDIEAAARAMAGIGIAGAELRVLWGKNIMDLSDDELCRAKNILDQYGITVVGIASPLLKCVLPDSPPLDKRFEHDVFASAHTYQDQARLLRRSAQIARKMGTRLIRVFSFWRTEQQESCMDRVAEELWKFAADAAREDLILGLENEHACMAGTGQEVASLLRTCSNQNLKVVWDPANAYVAGEEAFPAGFDRLPAGSVVHVHAKDCRMVDGRPVWLPLGTGALDWKGQLAALAGSGYAGCVSLETHWDGPGGDKLQGSVVCGCNLRGLLSW
jgi:sugar phosphate isomerase/epimerase